MPGSATIGANLVDSLLGVVDDLRGSLHPDMGVRQWRVYRRTRTWSGGKRGNGATVDVDVEILPQPLVSYDLKRELVMTGMSEIGDILLSEISLTYTEAELTGMPVASAASVFYVLRDAHGQGMVDRYFVLAEPPRPDRVETIGWIMRLKRAEGLDDDC